MKFHFWSFFSRFKQHWWAVTPVYEFCHINKFNNLLLLQNKYHESHLQHQSNSCTAKMWSQTSNAGLTWVTKLVFFSNQRDETGSLLVILDHELVSCVFHELTFENVWAELPSNQQALKKIFLPVPITNFYFLYVFWGDGQRLRENRHTIRMMVSGVLAHLSSCRLSLSFT